MNKKSEVKFGFFGSKLAFVCGCGCDSNFDCISVVAPVVQISTVKVSAKKLVIKPVPMVVAEDSNYVSGGNVVKMSPVSRIYETYHSKRKLAKHNRETIRKAA